MKVKAFKIPDSGGRHTIKIPQNGWLLDFNYQYSSVFANVLVENDDEPLVDKEIFVISLPKLRYYSNEQTIKVEDLLFLGSCGSPEARYFIFSIEPKE